MPALCAHSTYTPVGITVGCGSGLLNPQPITSVVLLGRGVASALLWLEWPVPDPAVWAPGY
jgi:hypothetical protein